MQTACSLSGSRRRSHTCRGESTTAALPASIAAEACGARTAGSAPEPQVKSITIARTMLRGVRATSAGTRAIRAISRTTARWERSEGLPDRKIWSAEIRMRAAEPEPRPSMPARADEGLTLAQRPFQILLGVPRFAVRRGSESYRRSRSREERHPRRQTIDEFRERRAFG